MSVFERLGVVKNCNTFGCKNKVDYGFTYCMDCTEKYKVKNGRKTVDEFGEPDVYEVFYSSSKWKKKRDKIKKDYDDLCQRCLGFNVATPADEVHHIIPLREDFSLRLDDDNLIPLCKECHEFEDSENRRKKKERRLR